MTRAYMFGVAGASLLWLLLLDFTFAIGMFL